MSNCTRVADHVPLEQAEAEELYQWCQPAFARGRGRRQSSPIAAEPVARPPRGQPQVAASGKHISSQLNAHVHPNSELGELNCFVVVVDPPPSQGTGAADSHCHDNPLSSLPPFQSSGGSSKSVPTATTSTASSGPTPPKTTNESQPANEPHRPFQSGTTTHDNQSTATCRTTRQPTWEPSERIDTTEQRQEARGEIETQPISHDNLEFRVRHPYERDQLDNLIEQASRCFSEARDWKQFANTCRDPVSDFHTGVGRLAHPAAHLLNNLRTEGAAVNMSALPWSRGRKKAALARGAHKSAKQHIDFLREEHMGMMQKGHWTTLPARMLADELELRLSPLGVVPQ